MAPSAAFDALAPTLLIQIALHIEFSLSDTLLLQVGDVPRTVPSFLYPMSSFLYPQTCISVREERVVALVGLLAFGHTLVVLHHSRMCN